MRDPKRIRKFWEFMCNALGDMANNGRDPFFPEEDVNNYTGGVKH